MAAFPAPPSVYPGSSERKPVMGTRIEALTGSSPRNQVFRGTSLDSNARPQAGVLLCGAMRRSRLPRCPVASCRTRQMTVGRSVASLSMPASACVDDGRDVQALVSKLASHRDRDDRVE